MEEYNFLRVSNPEDSDEDDESHSDNLSESVEEQISEREEAAEPMDHMESYSL